MIVTHPLIFRSSIDYFTSCGANSPHSYHAITPIFRSRFLSSDYFRRNETKPAQEFRFFISITVLRRKTSSFGTYPVIVTLRSCSNDDVGFESLSSKFHICPRSFAPWSNTGKLYIYFTFVSIILQGHETVDFFGHLGSKQYIFAMDWSLKLWSPVHLMVATKLRKKSVHSGSSKGLLCPGNIRSNSLYSMHDQPAELIGATYKQDDRKRIEHRQAHCFQKLNVAIWTIKRQTLLLRRASLSSAHWRWYF